MRIEFKDDFSTASAFGLHGNSIPVLGRLALSIATGLLLIASPAVSVIGDEVFLSFSDFGEGNAFNNSELNAAVGDIASVFIWANPTESWDTLSIEIDDTPFHEVSDEELFNADIIAFPGQAEETFLGNRWDSPISGTDAGITSFVGLGGFGARGLNPDFDGTNEVIDSLYDPLSNAFLVGRLDVLVQSEAEFSLPVSFALVSITPDGGVTFEEKVRTRSVTFNSASIPEPTSSGLVFALATILGCLSRRNRGGLDIR